MSLFVQITQSLERTEDLAIKLAQQVHKGIVICLEGELGSGKTFFVQSMAKAFGVQERVISSTFNLMNIYHGSHTIIHFDLYRLETLEELDNIGFYEYTNSPEGIVFIEWSEKFLSALPDDYIKIRIEILENKTNARRIIFSHVGNKYQNFMKEFEQYITNKI